MTDINESATPLVPAPTLNTISDRITSAYPNQFRILQKPDGSSVMQSGYSWVSATESGIEWQNVPVIVE